MNGHRDSPEEINSPCVGVCEMDRPTGLCKGCGRTMEEIATWWMLSAEKRLEIMSELGRRMEDSFCGTD